MAAAHVETDADAGGTARGADLPEVRRARQEMSAVTVASGA
ncbi:hypothetical protein ACH4VX_23285 [Streptomyces sp. NPDC020731]